MTLRNLVVGVPAMLLCLVVQVAIVFWCVRYCARQTDDDPGHTGWLTAIRPLAVSMLAMMIANVLQIALWGCCSSGWASSRSCIRRSTTRR
jgi:hypothetical protein